MVVSFEQHLIEVKTELIKNAGAGHRLLAAQEINASTVPAACIMLVSAGSNAWEQPALVPCAVSLELLRLGIEKHYQSQDNPLRDKNLDIVSADYYYAQAIESVSRFGRGEIVSCLVKAIADVAESQAVSSMADDGLELSDYFIQKRAGLYLAAVDMGFLLNGDTDERVRNSLRKFVMLYSSISHLNGTGDLPTARDRAEALKTEVFNDLHFLSRQMLGALDDLVAHRLQ
jgi:hypothetical protein